jgi:hypothetical protein
MLRSVYDVKVVGLSNMAFVLKMLVNIKYFQSVWTQTETAFVTSFMIIIMPISIHSGM